MRVVVVVQARTGSSRLPGKVLLPACGASLLIRQVERIAAAASPTARRPASGPSAATRSTV